MVCGVALGIPNFLEKSRLVKTLFVLPRIPYLQRSFRGHTRVSPCRPLPRPLPLSGCRPIARHPFANGVLSAKPIVRLFFF